MEKVKVQLHTFSGGLWFAMWLFTMGYLHLPFWQSIMATVLWPYFLGASLS